MSFSVEESLKLDRVVVDRPRREAAVAIGAAWIAFLIVLPLYERDITQLSDMIVVGLIGAGLIVTGFAAASRVRPLPDHRGEDRLRLMSAALFLGALLGIANLVANLGLASLSPTIDALLVERLGQEISPWVSLFAGPVVEEVAFRLFLLSAVAFLLARFVDDARTVFWVALALSAVVFGVMHNMRPAPDDSSLAWIYWSGVALKSGLPTFLLGWIFWRWGLAYAIACHFAANGAHLVLEPLFGY